MGTENKGALDLPYIKLFTSDIDRIEVCFTREQAGEWLFAINAFAKDGTIRDVSPALIYPLQEYVAKLGAAKKKYTETCIKRAEAGRNGGKAKAANAKARAQQEVEGEQPADAFAPPTKKQYMDAVQHFRNSEEIHVDNFEAGEFFDKLKADSWKISGVSIRAAKEWQDALAARFPADEAIESLHVSQLPGNYMALWLAFKQLFGDFDGLRNTAGESYALIVANDFLMDHDRGSNGWTIEGQFYPVKEWSKALVAYTEAHATTEYGVILEGR